MFKALIVCFVLLSASSTAMASVEYGAICFSSDGKHWGWARRNSQAEANRVALAGCNKDAPKKDCTLRSFKAIAKAEGAENIGFYIDTKSLDSAKQEAMRECNKNEIKKNCKVTFTTTDPGFFSVAIEKKDDGSFATPYVAYAYDNSDEADKEALLNCKNKTGTICKIWLSSVISGPMKIASKPKPVPATSQKNCRPTTTTVRCTSKCTNGNCVVTYENGCRINVQVQPSFDPFTNQWNYPSPSC